MTSSIICHVCRVHLLGFFFNERNQNGEEQCLVYYITHTHTVHIQFEFKCFLKHSSIL